MKIYIDSGVVIRELIRGLPTIGLRDFIFQECFWDEGPRRIHPDSYWVVLE